MVTLVGRYICLLAFLLCASCLMAQRVKRVRGEYTYYFPENVTLEEAKRTALERAQLEAIANEFGTLISQSNTTFVSNVNGKSTSNFFSLSSSDVKGEWIETIGKPVFYIDYDQGMQVVKVSVEGRIREILRTSIDIQAKVLCNGTELKFEQTNFRSGDDLYLYFQSPVDGYLAVYLLEEVTQTVYCLLPYKASSQTAFPIKHDVPYILFSKEKAIGDKSEVIEYTMTCSGTIEGNDVYVVFSPQPFTKALSQDVNVELPRQLTFMDFQEWLAKRRKQDKELIINRIGITIKKND